MCLLLCLQTTGVVLNAFLIIACSINYSLLVKMRCANPTCLADITNCENFCHVCGVACEMRNNTTTVTPRRSIIDRFIEHRAERSAERVSQSTGRKRKLSPTAATVQACKLTLHFPQTLVNK